MAKKKILYDREKRDNKSYINIIKLSSDSVINSWCWFQYNSSNFYSDNNFLDSLYKYINMA
jgi:hypothetical protein